MKIFNLRMDQPLPTYANMSWADFWWENVNFFLTQFPPTNTNIVGQTDTETPTAQILLSEFDVTSDVLSIGTGHSLAFRVNGWSHYSSLTNQEAFYLGLWVKLRSYLVNYKRFWRRWTARWEGYVQIQIAPVHYLNVAAFTLICFIVSVTYFFYIYL